MHRKGEVILHCVLKYFCRWTMIQTGQFYLKWVHKCMLALLNFANATCFYKFRIKVSLSPATWEVLCASLGETSGDHVSCVMVMVLSNLVLLQPKPGSSSWSSVGKVRRLQPNPGVISAVPLRLPKCPWPSSSTLFGALQPLIHRGCNTPFWLGVLAGCMQHNRMITKKAHTLISYKLSTSGRPIQRWQDPKQVGYTEVDKDRKT